MDEDIRLTLISTITNDIRWVRKIITPDIAQSLVCDSIITYPCIISRALLSPGVQIISNTLIIDGNKIIDLLENINTNPPSCISTDFKKIAVNLLKYDTQWLINNASISPLTSLTVSVDEFQNKLDSAIDEIERIPECI